MKNALLAARFALSLGLVVSLMAIPSFAQKYEVHPYAGGLFLTDYVAFDDQIGRMDFTNPGVFGVKGGIFTGDSFEIEGNLGFLNQFNFHDAPNESLWGLNWEGLFTYNFFPARVAGVYPYISGGVGGLTLNNRDNETPNGLTNEDGTHYVVNVEPFFTGGPIPHTTRMFTIEDGATFLSLSYGGGVKAQRLWGPVGLRADFRGRTMPNFLGDGVHGFEMTGGLLFSWGER